MSEADFQVIRDQFDATNRRDFPAAMDFYADDVRLFAPVEAGPGLTGHYEGKEAVGRWFGEWFRAFGDDYRFEIDEMRMIGDLVFMHANHGGTGRASGAEVSGETFYLYGLRDGKIVSVGFYPTRDAALAAAEEAP
jgi:ketosteroid isomerase-like protein